MSTGSVATHNSLQKGVKVNDIANVGNITEIYGNAKIQYIPPLTFRFSMVLLDGMHVLVYVE